MWVGEVFSIKFILDRGQRIAFCESAVLCVTIFKFIPRRVQTPQQKTRAINYFDLLKCRKLSAALFPLNLRFLGSILKYCLLDYGFAKITGCWRVSARSQLSLSNLLTCLFCKLSFQPLNMKRFMRNRLWCIIVDVTTFVDEWKLPQVHCRLLIGKFLICTYSLSELKAIELQCATVECRPATSKWTPAVAN